MLIQIWALLSGIQFALKIDMRLFSTFIAAFIFLFLGSMNLKAQENQNGKPPSSQKTKVEYKNPEASLNVGAQKLRNSMIYHIDEKTHFGLNNGFKFGIKINF